MPTVGGTLGEKGREDLMGVRRGKVVRSQTHPIIFPKIKRKINE